LEVSLTPDTQRETTMSRNLYNQTAHIIATALDDAREQPATQAAIATITRKLADAFKSNNREFRYDKFFHAWGLRPVGRAAS
jgi:hypothetical protein